MFKALVLFIVFIYSTNLYADNSLSFYDEKDGQFDLSQYLGEAHGLLPVPILITEPAVGFGGGLGLVYLHDNFTGKKTDSGRIVPASMSGLVGGGTENGTKFLMGFHIGYYLEDRVRTISAIGKVDVNVDIYHNSKAIASEIAGDIFYQAIKFRVLDSSLFLGTAYSYSNMNTKLNSEISFPVEAENEYTNAYLEAIIEYDTRNNTLSPSSGYFINAKWKFFRKEFSSDNDFDKLISNGYFYMRVSKDLNINLKITGEKITGKEAPFSAYPFVSLRGMPSMKVQGENVLSSELELCWKFTQRWEGIVFGGIGKAFGSNQFGLGDESFNDATNNYTKGLGFRYLLARKFGLKMGIDVASSKYDNALYITFGSAWSGF